MPKAFRPEEKEHIRGRLIQAGESLFSLHGLRKVNVEELAATAGISKGAFYLFFPSKEALFFECVERAEVRFRRQVLEAVERPGPSPRARLSAALETAFSAWREMPLLRPFSRADYELLFRRLPPEEIAAHLDNDMDFIQTLAERCRAAGIPFTAPVERAAGLMLALFFVSLHETDLGAERFRPALSVLIELAAAYCLGEVALEQIPLSTAATGSGWKQA